MGADLRLGDWIVRPQRRIVERGEESNHIKPKSMAVFECLVAANGAPVSRNELFDTVWPGGVVSDDTLNRCIFELRKAFGDSARTPQVIETIPKFGFRLLLPVRPLEAEPLAADPLPDESGLGQQRHHDQLIIGLEPRPAIAVLPFSNLSSDTENAYFSDGMSEEILNALARFNLLPVIARTSSFQFKDQNRDVKDIGRLLGVTHVLEGTVRKEEKSVRLTVQLIDTTTGTHIWSEAYQREMSDVFEMQNEIARDIVDQVGVALGAQVPSLLNDLPSVQFMVAHPTSNLEAYELYLQGMQRVTSSNPGPSEQAEEYFDRAIALDSDYADAWAAKGYSLYALGRAGVGHSHIPASVYPEAIAAYRKALEIDPEHVFATGWLGVALMYGDFKWAEGMQLIQQSLARNSNDVELLSIYGMYLDHMKIEGAGEVIDRAFRLSPFDVIPASIKAGNLMRDGRVIDAARLSEISLIKDMEGYIPNFYSGLYNLVLGQLETAEEHFHKARLGANPVDRSLDVMESAIAILRGKTPQLTFEKLIEMAENERVCYFVSRELVGLSWEDEKTIVAVFDLAIKQRDREVHDWLFGPKPSLMPEADWHRMKELTGVTQFQSDIISQRGIAQFVARKFLE
jgi:TolB-like protein/Flp pilus assembly protein TadD